MDDIERQKQREADAVHDGMLRYGKGYELATDSKPVSDLLAHCLILLTEAIGPAQVELKTSKHQKLPKYALDLLSVKAEKPALITIGMMFNCISRSEFALRRPRLQCATKS